MLFALALVPWLMFAAVYDAMTRRSRTDTPRVEAKATLQPGYCLGRTGEPMAQVFLPCRTRIGSAIWSL